MPRGDSWEEAKRLPEGPEWGKAVRVELLEQLEDMGVCQRLDEKPEDVMPIRYPRRNQEI